MTEVASCCAHFTWRWSSIFASYIVKNSTKYRNHVSMGDNWKSSCWCEYEARLAKPLHGRLVPMMWGDNWRELVGNSRVFADDSLSAWQAYPSGDRIFTRWLQAASCLTLPLGFRLFWLSKSDPRARATKCDRCCQSTVAKRQILSSILTHLVCFLCSRKSTTNRFHFWRRSALKTADTTTTDRHLSMGWNNSIIRPSTSEKEKWTRRWVLVHRSSSPRLAYARPDDNFSMLIYDFDHVHAVRLEAKASRKPTRKILLGKIAH